MIDDHGLNRILEIASQAAKLIMAVYMREFSVEYKSENNPVTEADRTANDFICKALSVDFPGVPIVAEESEPSTFEGFTASDSVWFVDPLDGTKEFIAKNGEFAVMIGLAERHAATAGVIVCPALKRSFIGRSEDQSFEVMPDGTRQVIQVSKTRAMSDASIVVSRSHRSPRAIEMITERIHPRAIVPCGGAGVKAARIATGEADMYIQRGYAGMRWDACAPEALIAGAGGVFTDALGASINYGTEDLVNRTGFVATNGLLHKDVLQAMNQVSS